MNNETCEKNMDTFLSLDKYERIPLRLTLHLLSCKKCRTQVHYLSLAEKYASEPIKQTPIKDALENMPVRPVTMTKWIIWGIIMILLLVVFCLILNRIDRTSFAIFFNIIFGTLVTAYCVLFVGTNMDFFIKKIDKFQTV
ncbi:MAG: hypothetical protein J6N81_00855 [Treponema sp.]|uniref:hypothetical protein n=1 Tax=Treponema sp. TaxID=166 RepID=UPI001B17B8CF|nr:hypothetical protein [Treponema sp.]MBO6218111.1 hypothetical protein [Treponema sp.]MBQ8679653.1 hypothetical protein [Treponema sp.]